MIVTIIDLSHSSQICKNMEILLDLFGSTQSIPVMLVSLDLFTLIKISLIAEDSFIPKFDFSKKLYKFTSPTTSENTTNREITTTLLQNKLNHWRNKGKKEKK